MAIARGHCGERGKLGHDLTISTVRFPKKKRGGMMGVTWEVTNTSKGCLTVFAIKVQSCFLGLILLMDFGSGRSSLTVTGSPLSNRRDPTHGVGLMVPVQGVPPPPLDCIIARVIAQVC